MVLFAQIASLIVNSGMRRIWRNVGKGSFDFTVETTCQIFIARWYDSNAVTLSSSYIGPERTDSTRRWDKSRKEYVGIPRPFVVKSCNNLMGGIDFWTLISKYRYSIRSKLWYLYLFWHPITTALTQARLIYRSHCTALAVPKTEQLNQRKFQAADATSLIMVNAPFRKRGRRSRELKTTILQIKLANLMMPVWPCWTLATQPIKRRRCAFCNVACTHTACEKMWICLCLNEKRNFYREYQIAV